MRFRPLSLDFDMGAYIPTTDDLKASEVQEDLLLRHSHGIPISDAQPRSQ